MPRNIAVITGTRAEYGLLRWIMHEIQSRGSNLQLLVTGAHLSRRHGYTVKQIEADGFKISEKIDMQLDGDSPLELSHAMGRGLSSIASALMRLKPDILVILGDRYEMLAAATAGLMLYIPIAHIHGGEVTEGAMDESIRHAITKLSYWHFATAEPYAKRIIQLGENPARVFIAGAPGADNIARLDLLDRGALENELGASLTSPLLLLTYHPETLASHSIKAQLEEVLSAISAFPDTTVLITGANADTGGREINDMLSAYAQTRPRTMFHASLGSQRYLSAMRLADVVIGNSSSGMIEAPIMGCATVNIGDRQKGRMRLPHIIDTACERAAIKDALNKALSPDFRQSLEPATCFGKPGHIAPMIAEQLLMAELPAKPIKPFYDI